MNSLSTEVNSLSFLGSYLIKNVQKDLVQDTIHSCKQHGAYRVRNAALQQMRGNSDGLADVDLAAYKSSYENLLHISNLAFDSMTDEDKHIEFCENNCITPWLFK